MLMDEMEIEGMEKKAKVPKLRFPGFVGEWEERKLGDMFVRRMERNNGSFDNTKWISVANMFYQEPEKVTSNNIDTRTYIMRLGDIAFEGHPNQEFRYGRFVENDVGDGIISELFPIYRHMGEYDLQYWKYAIHIEWIFAPLLVKCVQISYTSSNKLQEDEFLKQRMFVPMLKEQIEIGGFLQKIDKLITLCCRKLTHLQAKKKCLLQKMFPKKGERFPELRFPGFTDAWEQCKLLDNIDKIIDFRGRTPKKLGMEWSDAGYLALSAINVKNGYIDYTIEAHYADSALYDAWMSGNELHKGQVVFTTEAPMGNVAQIPDHKRYILSQRTIAFEVKEKLITENYLAIVLRTPRVFLELRALSSGGTAKGISQKSLSSFEIVMPKNIQEQEKIAMFFSGLDKLINANQKKLAHLQTQKKALLQQMFV